MVHGSADPPRFPSLMPNRNRRYLPACLLALTALAGCAPREPPAQPSFYRSLAEPGAELDASAAQSMISGYRQNNGLSAVHVYLILIQIAPEQERHTAARCKYAHSTHQNCTRPVSASR